MSFLNISKNLSSPRDRERERESKGSGEGRMSTNHRIAISFITNLNVCLSYCKIRGKKPRSMKESRKKGDNQVQGLHKLSFFAAYL